jgi:hypothetical protein
MIPIRRLALAIVIAILVALTVMISTTWR